MASRCSWCGDDPLYVKYHDEEWGIPVHDDRVLFEFLILESAQAGLSWISILRRRENYREAFLGFDPEKVSKLRQEDVETLMKNEGIIRNRKKIESAIGNAKIFLEIQKAYGSFDKYLWDFAGGQVITGHAERLEDVPAKTELSERLSKDLKNRGMKFVGPTIMYAYLQAVGVVNDHVLSCDFR